MYSKYIHVKSRFLMVVENKPLLCVCACVYVCVTHVSCLLTWNAFPAIFRGR